MDLERSFHKLLHCLPPSEGAGNRIAEIQLSSQTTESKVQGKKIGNWLFKNFFERLFIIIERQRQSMSMGGAERATGRQNSKQAAGAELSADRKSVV